MKIDTKFSIGQDVVLFNGVSMKMEHDEVFAVLVAPGPVEGKSFDASVAVSKALAGGDLEVRPQYQLQHHQGLLDEAILFESEDACKTYYREFFSR